jgi:hypothetical protein
MSVKRDTKITVTWECDRCGQKAVQPSAPAGWRAMFVVNPEQDARYANNRIHLCNFCLGSYEEWFMFPKSYPTRTAE